MDFAWSWDGAWLAASTTNGQVLIWGIPGGRLIKSFPVGSTDGPIAWSPDGKQMATQQGEKISFWDIDTGGQEKILEGAGQFTTGQGWSPDGKLFATFDDKVLKIWDTHSWTTSHIIMVNEGSNLTFIAWSPNSQFLAGVGNLYVWDVATGDQTTIDGSNSSRFYSVQWFPDNAHLVIEKGWVYELIKKDLSLFISPYPYGGATSAAISPDGQYLATGENVIVLRDPKDGSVLQALDGAANHPERLAFSPDGKILASLSKEDGTIVLWKVP